jgi:hypothetical protein
MLAHYFLLPPTSLALLTIVTVSHPLAALLYLRLL